MLEKFNPSDKIKAETVSQIEKYLDHILKPLETAMKKYRPHTLIGTSGSFDTLAEMIGYRFYNRNVIKNGTN